MGAMRPGTQGKQAINILLQHTLGVLTAVSLETTVVIPHNATNDKAMTTHTGVLYNEINGT